MRTMTKWTDRLALDIALRLEGSETTVEEILQDHDITEAALLRFNTDKHFLKKVSVLRTEIAEKGLTFRRKARTQAEMLLDKSWDLIADPSVSPAVKADLIKSTVKWADLEPDKNSSLSSTPNGATITINIGGPDGPTKVAIGAKEVIDG